MIPEESNSEQAGEDSPGRVPRNSDELCELGPSKTSQPNNLSPLKPQTPGGNYKSNITFYLRMNPSIRVVSSFFTTQVKDLRVTISPDLTWDTHINTILAKANRSLAFLHHNSVMSFTTDHRKLLYLTFVRSYIGYASEAWAPSTIGSITKIETLQRGQPN